MTKTAARFVDMTPAAAALSSSTGSAARALRASGPAHSAGDRIDSARLCRHAKRKTKTSHSRRCALWSGKTSGTTARGRGAPTSSGWTSSLTGTRRHHGPAPPWRAPACALPDPGADPRIYAPDHEHYDNAQWGSLPPIGNLPDSSGYVTPRNLNNYRTIVVTLTTRLPIAFSWLVGDAEWAMGVARCAHGAEWGYFFHCGGALTPGATERLMAAYLTWRDIPPPRSLRSLVQRAQQPQPGTYGNAATARMMARGTRLDGSSYSPRRTTATITTLPPGSRATTATRATNVRAQTWAATSSTSPSPSTSAPHTPVAAPHQQHATDATLTTGDRAPSRPGTPQSPRH